MTLQVTGLRSFVVLQQRVVSLGLHDLLPGNVLSVAKVIVLQDGHTPRPDLVQGLEVERLQRGLDNVQGREILCQVSASDDLKISKC